MRARFLLGLFAVALSAMVWYQSAPVAHADVIWCEGDPIVQINGVTVSITVAVQGSPAVVQSAVKSATIVIAVPEGTRTRLVSTTSPYFAERVRFVELDSGELTRTRRATPVQVAVSFDASTSLPARMTITGPATAPQPVSGTTSGLLTASFILP